MGFPKEVKASVIAPTPTVVSHKSTKALRHNTYTEDQGQSPVGSWISVNSDKSRIVDSVGHVLVLSRQASRGGIGIPTKP